MARAQGITQPALSRTLAELEDLLGQPLFLRQGRRLVLTEGGKLFRRHAAMALEALDAGAAALSPGTSGKLRLGVLPTAATRMVPHAVLRFRELRPEITLSVETGPHHHLIRLLREGKIDVMIGRLPDVSEMPGLSFEHLYEEDVILVGRAGHPMAGQALVEALTAVPLILPPQHALIRRPVEDYLVSIGLSGLRPMVETVSLAIGRGVCLESDALWFISRGVVADELERGLMMELPVGAKFLSGAVGMTKRQNIEANGLSVLELVTRELAQQMPPIRQA